MPEIKLTYFDIDGIAEQIRLTLILSNIDFEDVRVKKEDWPNMKSKMPYEQLPIMSIDSGEPRGQSGAMLRYAATLNPDKNMYPMDKIYDVEEALGLLEDMQKSFAIIYYIAVRPEKYGYPEGYHQTEEGMDKVKKMRLEWVSETLPKYLGYLSDMIDRNGGKWLVSGENPTIADCRAVPYFRAMTGGFIDHIDPGCLETHPKIIEYVNRFCSLPEIKDRYSS